MALTRRKLLKGLAQTGLFSGALDSQAALRGRRSCRQNLGAIHDAVMAFKKETGGLPPGLTALVTAGFIDRRLLICPLLAENGLNRPGNQSLVSSLPNDRLTLYQWEYTPDQVTRHEKQRMVGAGDWVPMARCGEHPDEEGNSHLNLALNGSIYASRTLWEFQLRDLIPFPYLFSAKIINENPVVPMVERIPGRSPHADARQLDLGSAFNSALTDSWPEGYEGEQAPEILALGGGRQLWDHEGAVFEIRGLVQLEGTRAAAAHPEFNEARFPSVRKLPEWNIETGEIHLLCGVIREQAPGTAAATVSVETSTGAVLSLDLRHGVHVSHGASLKTPGGATIAWSRPRPEVLVKARGSPDTAALSLSHVVWPLGGRMGIRRLIFKAADSACYPFLCAVTAA